jgi:hypothetical protein
MAKHKIQQVNIGDEIQYSHRQLEIPPDNWKVVAKLDKSVLLIERVENGELIKRMIELETW